MSHSLSIALLTILASGTIASADVEPVFVETFENASTVPFKNVTIVSDGDGKVLKITQTDPTKMAKYSVALDLAKIAGHTISCSARVKAEGISAKPKPFNGVKIQLVLTKADGSKVYPDISGYGTGSWDWAVKSTTLTVPADAKDAILVVGLERVSGTVWIDDIILKLDDAPEKP